MWSALPSTRSLRPIGLWLDLNQCNGFAISLTYYITRQCMPNREEICDEDDDLLWNRYRLIGSGASNRTQHARSSRCPRELFASLHGSCRVRQLFSQLSGESALCPSCGAPHRSPDSPSPWLLNREGDGRRAVTKRASSEWLQARACSHPRKHPGTTLSETPFGQHEALG